MYGKWIMETLFFFKLSFVLLKHLPCLNLKALQWNNAFSDPAVSGTAGFYFVITWNYPLCVCYASWDWFTELHKRGTKMLWVIWIPRGRRGGESMTDSILTGSYCNCSCHLDVAEVNHSFSPLFTSLSDRVALKFLPGPECSCCKDWDVMCDDTVDSWDSFTENMTGEKVKLSNPMDRVQMVHQRDVVIQLQSAFCVFLSRWKFTCTGKGKTKIRRF